MSPNQPAVTISAWAPSGHRGRRGLFAPGAVLPPGQSAPDTSPDHLDRAVARAVPGGRAARAPADAGRRARSSDNEKVRVTMQIAPGSCIAIPAVLSVWFRVTRAPVGALEDQGGRLS
jgi:hypothetical protein